MGTAATTIAVVTTKGQQLFSSWNSMLSGSSSSSGRSKEFFHSCGSIGPLIADLIEAGVQISARGMDPLELKREFGQDLVFWGGGADMQHTVPFGSLEEVRAQVRELVSIFAPGGGYVFAPVHNI